MTAPTADSDKYSTGILVRRLLMEVALSHWRLYAIGFALMLVAAAATAATAYLLGTMINETVVTHNFRGIVFVSLAAMGIFTAKGFAAYGGAVTLSRIGNRIIAENQRRMFDKLLHENIGFFADRHSSEFIARLTTGTVAVSQVINLLITAIGRDLMSLIGLCIVMVVQDPAMSIGGVIIAPPAFLFLRRLIRRVRGIARMQFTSGTQIIETMQEALQGMRMVKAFALEDEMRRRLAVSVGSVEHESNKMARVANRASPLMEMLGGFAIALASIYAGYRVIYTGAMPGEFGSFLAAFLLAYEPAKRLARLNIDLTNNLVGVRVLYEVIDSPAGEPDDDHLPTVTLPEARGDFCRPERPGHGAGRTFGRRQVDGAEFAVAVLRRQFRQHHGRRAKYRRRIARLVARSDPLCRADQPTCPRLHPRQYRTRETRRQRRGDRRRRQGGACARFHFELPGRLRHSGRRARLAALRRAAPARRHRTRADQECADHPARRSDRVARFRIRALRARGGRRTLQGAQHDRHRPPAVDDHACRQHSRRRGRSRRRVRTPRRAVTQGRPLCLVLPAAASRAARTRTRHRDCLKACLSVALTANF